MDRPPTRRRLALSALIGVALALALALLWPRPEVDIRVEVVPPPTAETVLVSGVPDGLPTGAPGEVVSWEPRPGPVEAVEDHGWWYAQVEEELEEIVRHCGDRAPIVRCEGLACAIWQTEPMESGVVERARRRIRRPERLLYDVAWEAELLEVHEIPCVAARSALFTSAIGPPGEGLEPGQCMVRYRRDLFGLDADYRSETVDVGLRLCRELMAEQGVAAQGHR